MRLGIAGGEWKKMMADATARTRFASEVKKIIEQYDFDGVDFDFEWPTNTNEFNNYSATVIQMRSTLGKYVYFTASLHPVSFKISPCCPCKAVRILFKRPSQECESLPGFVASSYFQ